MFSGSSREIFFREINAWYPFIRFVGFGCFNGGTDSAFRWRHARFTRTWKREEQIGPLRTHYSLSKNPREFSFQNMPSDLKRYRTFREAGLCSVRSLLPWWVGRHGNCTSAWSSHHLVSFAAVIKVVTQRSFPLVGGGGALRDEPNDGWEGDYPQPVTEKKSVILHMQLASPCWVCRKDLSTANLLIPPAWQTVRHLLALLGRQHVSESGNHLVSNSLYFYTAGSSKGQYVENPSYVPCEQNYATNMQRERLGKF